MKARADARAAVPLAWLWMAVLVLVWSSAVFENGLSVFAQQLGVSVFMACSLALLVMFCGGVVMGWLRLVPIPFFREHPGLFATYALYWAVSLLGVLLTPPAALDTGLVATTQFLWYSAIAGISLVILHHLTPGQRRTVWVVTGALILAVLLAASVVAVVTGVAVVATLANAGTFSVSAYGDYNMFTLSLLFGVLLLFAESGGRDDSRWKVTGYVLMVGIAVLLGAMGGSRRSLLLYGPTSLLMLFLLELRRSPRAVIGAVGVLLIVAGGAGWLLSGGASLRRRVLPEAAERATEQRLERSVGFFTGEHSDVTSRTDRWAEAVEVLRQYSIVELLVGRGTRSYMAAPEFRHWDGSTDKPHNFLLTAFLEGGLVKALVLAAFIGLWWYHVLRAGHHLSPWRHNLLITASLLWMLTVTISGEEFFVSRQFLLLPVVWASWPSGEDDGRRSSEASAVAAAEVV